MAAATMQPPTNAMPPRAKMPPASGSPVRSSSFASFVFSTGAGVRTFVTTPPSPTAYTRFASSWLTTTSNDTPFG